MNEELWRKIMATGKRMERGMVNSFSDGDVETILAIMDFMGATEVWPSRI